MTINMILPELIVLGGALILLIGDMVIPRIKLLWFFVALFTPVLAIFYSISCSSLTIDIFGGMLKINPFLRFFDIIFLSGTVLVFLIGKEYYKKEGQERTEFYFFFLIATLSMMLLSKSQELIMIFLSLEMLSITSYILVGKMKYKPEYSEASLKYFIQGAFAGGVFILGIVLIYSALGTVSIDDIFDRFKEAQGWYKTLAYSGLAFIIAGFGFKIVTVPFHMWVPDIYQNAPIPVVAFLGVGPKAAGFSALLSVLSSAFPYGYIEWVPVLWILSALSMTAGNLFALPQRNIKRLLAYSTIAHAGYVLASVVSSVSGGYEKINEFAIGSIPFYMLAYLFMSMGLFALVSLIAKKGEQFVNIDDYKGLAYKRPGMALAMAIFLFSLAGIPPTAGFMAKMYVFIAVARAGFWVLALIAFINAVISAYYYLRIIVYMYMEKGTDEVPEWSFLSRLVVWISVIGTFYMGIFPGIFIHLSRFWQ